MTSAAQDSLVMSAKTQKPRLLFAAANCHATALIVIVRDDNITAPLTLPVHTIASRMRASFCGLENAMSMPHETLPFNFFFFLLLAFAVCRL